MQKVSQEIEDSIVALTNDGQSSRIIAKQLKISQSVVLRVQKRRAVVPKVQNNGRKKLLTPEDARLMLSHMQKNEGLTPMLAAMAINKPVSRWTARRAVQKIGADVKEEPSSSKKRRISKTPPSVQRPPSNQTLPPQMASAETAVSQHTQQQSHQQTYKDEADIYAEAWAVTFRKLSPDQKIFAKRLMDDTLVYAQLGQLSINSSINPAQPSRTSSHYSSQSAEVITNEADQSLSYCEAIVKCEDTMYIT